MGQRVGPCNVLFEACSAFTHGTACTPAKSQNVTLYTRGFSHFVTSMTAPVASGWSECCRVGLAPTEDRRLSTAYAQSGHQPVPSIYSIVPPNDGSALRHGHHFEPVDFVIDHGRGRHDAYSAGSCQRTYARACGCRQRPRRHREELIESERGWSGREAFVTMMQTADLGQGNDRSGPGRLNGSSIRCVLAERQVGP